MSQGADEKSISQQEGHKRAKETNRLLSNLPLVVKTLLSHCKCYAFTYRPLSTTDAGVHNQKRKPQKAKAVQPQEVNHRLQCVFCGPQLMILSLSLVVISTQQCFTNLSHQYAILVCSKDCKLVTTHSESSPLPFVKCKRLSKMQRLFCCGLKKATRIKKKKKGRCQLPLPPFVSLCVILGRFLIPFAIS